MPTNEDIRHLSSCRLWIGAVLFVCLTAAFARAQEESPPDLKKLESEFDALFKGKSYTKALAVAEKVNEVLLPKHVTNLFNIACLHCLLGDKDKAYAWLEKAIDSGFWYAHYIMKEEKLKSLRGEEKFKHLIRKAWAKGYIHLLEREERKTFQKPEKVMEVLAFKKGERVADVGAGSGYFTVRVAKAVGKEGKVWAIDASQEMLDYLAQRVKDDKLDNVHLKKVGREDPEVPKGSVDTILVIDTLHYVKDRVDWLKKLKTGLAEGGRVVIIDYRPKPMKERPWGPPPEQQISRETVDTDMVAAGFEIKKAYEFLPEQYFVEYVVK